MTYYDNYIYFPYQCFEKNIALSERRSKRVLAKRLKKLVFDSLNYATKQSQYFLKM